MRQAELLLAGLEVCGGRSDIRVVSSLGDPDPVGSGYLEQQHAPVCAQNCQDKVNVVRFCSASKEECNVCVRGYAGTVLYAWYNVRTV
jgi:hypothetical protein